MAKKVFKWVLTIIGIAILISILGYVFISPIAERIFRAELTKALKGKYLFSYSNFRLHILTGGVTITDAVLLPTSQITKPANPQRNHYKIEIDKIQVHGIGYYQLYYNRLIINSINIESPVISIFNLVSEKTTPTEEFNFYELIKTKIGSISIQKVKLSGGRLALMKNDSSNVPKFILNNFNIEFKGLFLDSSIAANNLGWPKWKRLDIVSTGNQYLLPDKLHTLQIPHLSWSDTDSLFLMLNTRVFIDSIKLVNNFDIYLPKLSVEKSDLHSLLAGNIFLGNINVYRPQLRIKLHSTAPQNNSPDSLTIPLILKKNFPPTNIKQFSIIDGKIKIIHSLKNLDITLEGIHCNYDNIIVNVVGIPDHMVEQPSSKVTIKDSKVIFKDSIFTLSGYNLTIDRGTTLRLDKLKLEPKYAKKKFAAHYGRHTEWTRLEISKMAIHNTNFIDLIFFGDFYADHIMLSKATLEVYRNKVYRKNQHIHLLPGVVLQQSTNHINIKKIHVSNAEIVYEEVAPRREGSSTIFFKEVSGSLVNITNEKHAIHLPMVANVSGKMFGMAKINLHIKFNLKSPNGFFHTSGSMGTMDMKLLNGSLRNAAMLSVKSGTADSLNFSFNANDTQATGQMYFYYHDLKLEILQRRSFEKKGVKAHVGSFLLDKLIVKSENPEKNNDFRVSAIYYKRNNTKSFFNYLSKSMLSGFVATVAPAVAELKSRKEKP